MLTRIADELGINQDAPQVFHHPLPDGLVAFSAADDRTGSTEREAIEQVRNIRCGLVEQVRCLEDLHVAAQAARALASLVEDSDQQALTTRNVWARLARYLLSESGVPVVPDVEATLLKADRQKGRGWRNQSGPT